MNEQTQETNQPTSAAALRAKSRQSITNPGTGNTYIVRRATSDTMIKSGHLPSDFFFEQAQRITQDADDEDDRATPANLTSEELGGFKDDNLLRVGEITRAIVSCCLLSPRVVERVEDEADASVIEYEDIPPEDRAYIRAWYEYRLDEQKIKLESGGEVTRQEAENFPAGKRQSEPDRTGSNGE
jgi:hypothetical protein